MIDQIGIDGILQVAALVVREEDVDGFGTRIAAIGAEFGARFGGNAVVNGVDDVSIWGEEAVCFYLFEGLGDGFLTEGAADLFEGEKLRRVLVLDEVDVGEAALGK